MSAHRTGSRLAAAAALLLLSACAGAVTGRGGSPTAPPLLLPVAAYAGPASPASNIVSRAAESFANPAALAGRPAEAILAVIQLEWLAVEVPRDLSFSNFSSITAPALGAARDEVRAALGIAPAAPPAAVIDALGNAYTALRLGEPGAAAASLAPPLFAPGALDRLANLPRLPQANAATRRAQRDLEFGRDDLLEFGARAPGLPGPG